MKVRNRINCFTSDTQISENNEDIKNLTSFLCNVPASIYEIIQSPNPCFLTNKQGRVLYVNNAWEDLYGYSNDTMYMKNFNIVQGEKTDINIIHEFCNNLRIYQEAEMNIYNYDSHQNILKLNVKAHKIFTHDYDEHYEYPYYFGRVNAQ